MSLKTLEYTVRFLTPAFLGNAGQDDQWRTPPFKALLRQWWRVAYAADRNFKVSLEAMRKEEGQLFGHAWLQDASGKAIAARKSDVRIRLENWSLGNLKSVPELGQVSVGTNRIPAALYSGYGPIDKGPRLKRNAALQAGAEARLRIAFPTGRLLEQAITLMHHYGTAGGRSRNGWGSFILAGEIPKLEVPARDWQLALNEDWCHAIGRDQSGPLIWQTAPQSKWEDALRIIAQTRADLRRAVPDRLILAYPDTKKEMPGWSKNDRVPNSLRFKVRADAAGFVGMIYHAPCKPPDELWNKLQPQKRSEYPTTFAKAHMFLDEKFQRAEY
jgi:CRISPR-associated protein Cmr1